MRFLVLATMSLIMLAAFPAYAQSSNGKPGVKLYNSQNSGDTGRLYNGGTYGSNKAQPLPLKQIIEGRSKSVSYSSQVPGYRPYGTAYTGSSLALSPQQMSKARYERDKAARQREAKSVSSLSSPTYSEDLKEEYLKTFQGQSAARPTNVSVGTGSRKLVYKGRDEQLKVEAPKRVFNSPY